MSDRKGHGTVKQGNMSKVKEKSVKTREKRRQRGKEVVRSSEVNNLSESLFSPLVKSVRRKRIRRRCRKQVKG